jgi:hypothetical protein
VFRNVEASWSAEGGTARSDNRPRGLAALRRQSRVAGASAVHEWKKHTCAAVCRDRCTNGEGQQRGSKLPRRGSTRGQWDGVSEHVWRDAVVRKRETASGGRACGCPGAEATAGAQQPRPLRSGDGRWGKGSWPPTAERERRRAWKSVSPPAAQPGNVLWPCGRAAGGARYLAGMRRLWQALSVWRTAGVRRATRLQPLFCLSGRRLGAPVRSSAPRALGRPTAPESTPSSPPRTRFLLSTSSLPCAGTPFVHAVDPPSNLCALAPAVTPFPLATCARAATPSR